MRTKTAVAATATLCMLILTTGCGNDAENGNGAYDTADEPTASASTSEEATEEPTEEATEEPEPTEPAEEVVITIEEFMYSELEPVAPGTEITVENTDAAAHTLTADTDSDGDFDLTIAPGESETLTAPEQAGEYPYVCSFHAGMTATLRVE